MLGVLAIFEILLYFIIYFVHVYLRTALDDIKSRGHLYIQRN